MLNFGSESIKNTPRTKAAALLTINCGLYPQLIIQERQLEHDKNVGSFCRSFRYGYIGDIKKPGAGSQKNTSV